MNEQLSTNQNYSIFPILFNFAKEDKIDTTIYDYKEPYNDKTQMLDEGLYCFFSKKKQTMCCKFLSKKKHADDTKEK